MGNNGDTQNLLVETLEALTEKNKTRRDVLWVGVKENYVSWKVFEVVAAALNYDAGYGGAEVAEDLVVVGKDFWLERAEYDGSEWWVFKKFPERPNSQSDIINFASILCCEQ